MKLLLDSRAPAATILVRLMVGAVFLSEGLQKWLFADLRGAGRFEKIGLPAPEILGHFVGGTEVICGLLILLGLLTRIAALPLLVIMMVALVSTKWPILLSDGFWVSAHAARTDFSMFLGSLFLLIVGGGKWSLDAYLLRKNKS